MGLHGVNKIIITLLSRVDGPVPKIFVWYLLAETEPSSRIRSRNKFHFLWRVNAFNLPSCLKDVQNVRQFFLAESTLSSVVSCHLLTSCDTRCVIWSQLQKLRVILLLCVHSRRRSIFQTGFAGSSTGTHDSTKRGVKMEFAYWNQLNSSLFCSDLILAILCTAAHTINTVDNGQACPSARARHGIKHLYTNPCSLF